MRLFETKHEKKSAIITSIIMVAVLLSLFIIGLRYMDPPIEYGVAVNFGTTDFGRGKAKSKTVLKKVLTKVKVNKTEKRAEPVVKKQKSVKEKVVTQDKLDAPVIAKTTKKSVKKSTTKKKVVVKKKPKPDKTTTDILSNLINGPKNKGKAKEGDGNDAKQGNKGQKDGDLNTKNYYGKGGKGGGGNYNLGNRKAVFTPKPIYDCNEEGLVVVSIEVDTAGRVISANAGVKGSTTSAPCLLERAKNAALKTVWQPDTTAPNKQIGSIIYNFSLSN